MKTRFLSLLLLVSFAIPANAQLAESTPQREVPPDFKSDGCSGWPDGDYRVCCEAHDLDYYYGGTAAERKASDKRLYKCVRDKGHQMNAILMLVGVRVAAVKWLPFPFRWGFGKKRADRQAAEMKRSTGDTSDTAAATSTN